MALEYGTIVKSRTNGGQRVAQQQSNKNQRFKS